VARVVAKATAPFATVAQVPSRSSSKSPAERDPGVFMGTLILGALGLVLVAGLVMIVISLR
jgi:hypothetical protein